MKKFSVIFLILFLILSTAIIKNSTKRVDDMIFISEENIRDLVKNLANIKLEHDYLSSTEKLIELQKLYFEDQLVIKNIKEINIIKKKFNKLEIEQLRFTNEE
tara:strand:+ start:381 stop:689 length:309 start_codon:yes stop_codon:yes gene_type:complete